MKKRVPKNRPIRENLLRHLARAKEYRNMLYRLEEEGYVFGPVLTRAEEEVEKLTRLTS